MRLQRPTFLTAVVICYGSPAYAALYEQVVKISQGSLQGVAALNDSVADHVPNWDQISVFKGIPFGASTAYEMRWKAPKPADSWNGTLDASAFGPICPQSTTSAFGGPGAGTSSPLAAYSQSEDCLNLNIWTPANSSHERLPVMIWSYGAGTAAPQTTYDGAGMAAKGVVFVSYNYRAGALGFLATSSLSNETGYGASGNWGLLDQNLAVEWVYKNIAAFGGNPKHIIAVGQSFGAASTYHMVNSKLIKGKIVGAIAESGIRDPYDPNIPHFETQYQNLSTAEALGTEFLASINITTIIEGRSANISVLLEGEGSGLEPVLDYYAIPSKYITSLEEPVNCIPIITGNNRDENGASPTNSVNASSFVSDVQQNYGNLSSEFLSLYPHGNDTAATDSDNDLIREVERVSSWLYTTQYTKYTGRRSYTYFWDHAPPGTNESAHASEIVYALNNLYAQAGVNYTSQDYYVSNVMSSYWVNFIKTGNPNKGDSYTNGTLVKWPASSSTAEATFNIGDTFETSDVAATPARVALIKEWLSEQTPY